MALILGQNMGLGEIWQPSDILEAAAVGAPSVRIIPRWLGRDPPPGYGTNYQVDGYSEDQPHHIRPEQVQMLIAQAQASRAVGGEVMLGMDSNQLQGLNGGMDLWTSTDERKRLKRRRQFIKLTRYLAKQIRPRWLENIVEPGGTMTPSTLWAFYEESMSDVLEDVPDQRFAVSCRGYQPNYIGEAFNPAWASGKFAGHIDLTCNFQDDLTCNPVLFEDRLGKVLAQRDRWRVGVVVNQIWSFPKNDPDGAFLARGITRLAEEGVHSMVWTAVTKYEGGEAAGMRHLANPNDPNSAHVQYPERCAAVFAAWRAAAALGA